MSPLCNQANFIFRLPRLLGSIMGKITGEWGRQFDPARLRLRTLLGAGNGTRPIKAPVTQMAIFLPDFFILKTNRYHDLTTVLNERKHLKMVI